MNYKNYSQDFERKQAEENEREERFLHLMAKVSNVAGEKWDMDKAIGMAKANISTFSTDTICRMKELGII